jgi:serine/threonine protein kinase/Tfp pilus assembly protein PilF
MRDKPPDPLIDEWQAGKSGFRLQGEIARGGMGAVMRAVDTRIRREIAVKYLLDQDNPAKKLRFIEEAQITGQLEHPNIVPIHELGTDADGRLLFTMKMVRGRTLAQMLAREDGQGTFDKDDPVNRASIGPGSSLNRLLTILINVCNALAYAHARGVIHRDLKPANIMVGDFGEAYVMDWGLAKVLNAAAVDERLKALESLPSETATQPPEADRLPTVAAEAGVAPPGDTLAMPGPSAPPHSGSTTGIQTKGFVGDRIITDRLLQADMTQDGAILGTPVYMAPEQAAGQIEAIDQRSDVYALGAILYEMLTLCPPVSKEGGRPEILKRVILGEIVAPDERVRQSGSKRRVPPELAAMACKALARDPRQRYPAVESFRQDLERYLEGRSVSAREDSKREMLVKFVRRNKGLSIGIAATFVVLVAGLIFITHALLAMNDAYAAYTQEQEESLELDRKTVPTLLRAARLLTTEKQFADALGQVELALSFDPNQAEARLLRAKLLMGEGRFAEAGKELAECLKLDPKEEQAKTLLALGHSPNKLLVLADELARQNATTLADSVSQHANRLFADYRKRVETICPDGANRLTIDDTGMHLNLFDVGRVKDLKPLEGMPLTTINLSNPDDKPAYEVSDLSPLKGMPLTELHLSHASNIRSIAPLKGMPLRKLNMHNLAFVPDLAALQDLPLSSLDLWGCYSMSDLTPLKHLQLDHLGLPNQARDKDLLLLKDMPLTSLFIQDCLEVSDLTPIAHMKLTTLSIASTKVRDLTPIKHMPLRVLYLWLTSVQDLAPLRGMKLREIKFTPKNITRGIEVIREMTSLEIIGISWEGNAMWPAAVFWKKYDAGEFKK